MFYQAKSDQIEAARTFGARVPREGLGFSMVNTFADESYASLRELATVALWPTLFSIVSCLAEVLCSIVQDILLRSVNY